MITYDYAIHMNPYCHTIEDGASFHENVHHYSIIIPSPKRYIRYAMDMHLSYHICVPLTHRWIRVSCITSISSEPIVVKQLFADIGSSVHVRAYAYLCVCVLLCSLFIMLILFHPLFSVFLFSHYLPARCCRVLVNNS